MDYAGRRVTVMGLGRFGGGVGVVKFLSSRGAAVTVTDASSAEDLQQSVAHVVDLPGVSLVLGEHREEDFRDADLVVANPAVKPDNRFLAIARDAEVPVTTEIVLLVRELPNRLRTIGVTGSAGKSTTTAMIGHILRKALGQETETPRRQGAKTPRERGGPGLWVGGNLGGSLLPVVDQIGEDDWVVLELSSFMLHYLREEQWSPHIAVVTNLSPNHLDWHGTMEAYATCKRAILDHQQAGDGAVLGGVVDFDTRPGVLAISTTETEQLGGWRISNADELPGRHNQANAIQAQLAAKFGLHGVSLEAVGSAVPSLADFVGLPHRLQRITVPGWHEAGIRCFNDSKSTTPDAAVLGMEAFEDGSIHAILGGYDKGADLTEMCGIAADRCAGVYGIGATGGEIVERVIAAASALGRGQWASKRVVNCGTLENAVVQIRKNVQRGDVVLLSPGCASWDQFANYEERGERFVALIRGERE